MISSLGPAPGRARLALAGTVSILALASAVSADDVTWVGGVGAWNGALNWSGGAVPLATDNALVDGGAAGDSAVTVTTAATINDLTISAGDGVSVNNAQTFTLTGNLVNDGAFALNSGGSATTLDIADGATFSGAGAVSMNTSAGNRITGNAGALLTNDAGHAILGTGNIGVAQLVLDNAGLIAATQPSALTLNLQAGSTSANTGILRAEAGRTLTLATGGVGFTLDNSGGLIEALDGATVQLRSGVRVEGGTLDTAGSGVITLESSTTLDGVTNAGLVQVSAAGARLKGTIVNDGDLRLNSAGSTTTFSMEGDVRLEGAGALTATSFTANTLNSAAGFANSVLTNTADHTIRGSGNFGQGAMGLINEGLILADQAAAMTINLSNAVAQDSRRNSGIMRAENGATLAISSTVLDNTGGLIEARGAGSFVRLDGTGARIIGGTLNTEDDRSIVVFGGSALEDLRNDGNVRVQNSNAGKLKGVIENFGEIVLGSIGSTTTLEIEGDTTLTGDGRLRLTDDSGNRIIGAPATSVLTNDEDHRITGSGNLGVDNLGLINLGVIEAEGDAGLTVNLNNAAGVARENRGTMRALAGGTLTLADTDLDNAGGVIEAQSGGTVSFSGAGARIADGVLTGAGDFDLRASATLADLRNEGRTTIANVQTGRLEGAIDNAGVIALGSTGSTTTLTILGDTTLSGGGVLEMSDGANNRVIGSPVTSELTNAADHVIRGSGQLGAAGNLGLINAGLIEAVGSAGLTVLLNTDPDVTRSNSGVMRAADGSTLTLGASAFNMELANAGGLIEAEDGGRVVVAGSRILGGTLDSDGAGVIDLRNSGVLSDLRNDGFVQVANVQGGRLQGTVENFGEINLASSGSFTRLEILGDVTLTGPGLLTGSDQIANAIFGTPSMTLTQGADHTIRGAFNIGNSGNMALDNRGTIEAQGAAGITMRLSSEEPNANSGAIRALSGAELRLNGTVLDNAGGLIEANDGAAVTVTGGRIDGGRIDTDGTGVIDLAGSAVLADLRNDGNVRVSNNRVGGLAGQIENFGVIAIESTGSTTTLDLAEDTTLSGDGELVLGDRTQIRMSSVGGDKMLTNAAGHTIRGGGDIGIGAGSLGLANAGLIEADGEVALTVNPAASLGPVVNTGVMRASGVGGLSLTSGAFDNQGLVEAVNGSAVVHSATATTLNNLAGVLTGGQWRAAGDGSRIDIRGGQVATNAAEIILSGAGSAFRAFDGAAPVDLEASLQSNTGILRVLDDRDFIAANAIFNTGQIELGGGAFEAPALANVGLLTGFGTVAPKVLNSGLVQADGGELVLQGGIQGGAAVSLNADATLVIQRVVPNDFIPNEVQTLTLLDGRLEVADSFGIHVTGDYANTAFGVGDAFDRRANVSGPGEVIGVGAAMAAGGDVVAGVLDLGAVRDGASVTRSFTVENTGAGAQIRGAIQTGAGDGAVTDARLSGSGVTAQNFGAVAAGESAVFEVTFDATQGGALTGQTIGLVQNFDNVADLTIALEGLATQFAQGQAAPAGPIDLGAFRVGVDGPSQSFSATNLTDGEGAERLGIDTVGVSGNFSAVNQLGAGLVAPGATAAGALAVSVAGGAAGVNAGTLSIGFASDGTEIDAGFGRIASNLQEVAVSATGWNAAQGAVAPDPIDFGPRRVGEAAAQALTVSNAAPAAFSESLNAAFGAVSGDAVTNGGAVSGLAAGGADATAMTVGLDTSVAGARGGSVTVSFESDGAGTSGLAAVAAGSQTLALSAEVFQLAEGGLGVTSLNFGTVQVGQTVSQALSISNLAAGPAGYVEDLGASFGAAFGQGAGAISGVGFVSGLAAGQTDAGSMTVSVDTSAAGQINGGIAVDFVSQGTVGGVANGLAAIGVGSESFGVAGTIEATGSVIDAAQPQIDAPQPIALGNVRTGEASPTASVSVTNLATGEPQAALNAVISGAGAVTASGSFDLLAPGQTDATSLSVGLDTSTAGAVSGAAALAFVSDASNVGGCAPFCQMALPGGTVAVTGGVFDLAQPVVSDSVDLGAFRLGEAPGGQISVVNAPSGAPIGFQEALDFETAGTTGPVVMAPAAGTGLGPATAATLAVGLDGATATAGLNQGTATLRLFSNGEGTSGLERLELAPAEVTVSGTGYRIADPSLDTTAVTLAARRGDAAPTAALQVTNQSPDVFTEALDAAVVLPAPAGFAAAGAIAGLGAGQTDAASLSVALDTAAAGTFGGDLSVAFASSGAGTTGAADLALGTAEVALTGRVWEAAQAEVLTPVIDFGIVHVGEAVAARNVSVRNAAPAAALNDTLEVQATQPASGPFALSGGVAGLAAQQVDAAGIAVSLDTSAQGVFSVTGGLLDFVSRNPDLADLALGTGELTISAQINAFADPVFGKIGGAGVLSREGDGFTLDLGAFLIGDPGAAAVLAVVNDVTGPADLLSGSFDLGAGGPFVLGGFDAFAGLEAGEVFGGLSIAFEATAVGSYAQTVTLNAAGSNASGFFGAFDPIALTLRARVLQDAPAPAIPLPAPLALLGTALAALWAMRRRRAA